MERPAMHAAAERCPNHPRHRCPPTVMILSRDFGDLVEGTRDKIGELHFHHGAHTHHGRADRRSDKPGFSQRGVQYPPFAVFLLEAFRDPERAAVRADVLAHQENALVTRHLLIQRFRDCFEVSDLRGGGCRHAFTSSSAANTPSRISGPSGRGLCSANSTPASTSFLTRSSTSRRTASSA